MTDEEKNNLVVYVLTDKIKKANPEKYGNISTPEEWQDVFENDKAVVDAAWEELRPMTESEWDKYEQEYEATTNTPEYKKGGVLIAAKGAKLQKLRNVGKAKKCKCGCNMVDIKDKGGKITSVCSCRCGGEISKKEKGGLLKDAKEKLAKNRLIKKDQAGAKIAKPAQTKKPVSFKDKVAAEEQIEKKEYVKAYPKSELAKKTTKPVAKKPLIKEKGGQIKNRLAKAKLLNKK